MIPCTEVTKPWWKPWWLHTKEVVLLLAEDDDNATCNIALDQAHGLCSIDYGVRQQEFFLLAGASCWQGLRRSSTVLAKLG